MKRILIIILLALVFLLAQMSPVLVNPSDSAYDAPAKGHGDIPGKGVGHDLAPGAGHDIHDPYSDPGGGV